MLAVVLCVLILLALAYWAAMESKKPGRLKNFRRKVCTLNNIKDGLLNESIIHWCSLPITARLDQGGVPDGMLDITHPSVIALPKPWNGYDVWLAATPYPQRQGNDAQIYENTSIFHANRIGGLMPCNFTAIDRNPIIYGEEAEYNSDPDLFFEDSTMYVVTRKCNGPDYFSKIVLQNSKNGNKWSDPVSLIKTNRLNLCPCMIKIKGVYRMYMFNTHFDERYSSNIGGIITDNIEVWESKSLEKPDFKFVKSVPWKNDSNVWHGDILFYKDKFYLMYCGTNYDYKIFGLTIDTFKYLWLAVSDDGFHFKAYKKPLLKRSGIYRPTFSIDGKGILTVYFSTENSYWGKDHEKYPGGDRIGMFSVPFNDVLAKETF